MKISCPYCGKEFNGWISVRAHTSNCSLKTGEYYISVEHGPIHYTEFINKTVKQVRIKYPNLTGNIPDIRKGFKRNGLIIDTYRVSFSKEQAIKEIQDFVKTNNRIPQARDFERSSKLGITYGSRTISENFGTWNQAIEASGFIADYDDGYGTRTKGLDGVLYRSAYEAYFCDMHLYGKYNYVVEPKYPEPHNKYYDWYVQELDLYIELDGGLRPETILDKIKINKTLGRKILIIDVKKLKNFSDDDLLVQD